MMSNMVVLLTMALVGVVLAAGRPQQHYMDASSQGSNEEGNGNQLINGLTDFQLALIAQHIADTNNQMPFNVDRNLLRSPEMKRAASRFRQCYFNPVSCFRK